MAAECLAAIHLCRVRVTRLTATGSPSPGPNNSYVTDKPMTLTVTPTVEAGADLTLTGGCDCIIAAYRGYDKLKRFEFELDLGDVEPGLVEMLTGATIITATSDPIGVWWPTQTFQCATPPQPNVAFEAWQDGWNQDAQDPVWPYIHWLWPSSFWSIGAMTLQNDFMQPKLTGFSRSNTAWGNGIYHDQPTSAQPLGGFWYSTTRPSATCGYQTQAIT